MKFGLQYEGIGQELISSIILQYSPIHNRHLASECHVYSDACTQVKGLLTYNYVYNMHKCASSSSYALANYTMWEETHKHEQFCSIIYVCMYSTHYNIKKYLQITSLTNRFKGTQDWEFFWLRFWNLRYFFVSYVKILRFYKKKIVEWAIIGGGTIFPRSPRTTRNEKNFELRSKKFFFFNYVP